MTRFDGILIIDKPAGWTSHDVVGWTRRWLGQKKVGHAGTLDPAATGVLPVVVGEATKLVEHLSNASKRYVAEITFGVTTDSADVDGRVTAGPAPVTLTSDQVTAGLREFIGEIRQRPPMHSAVKVGGKRLYEMARAGLEIDVPERTVEITELALIEWESPLATVSIKCSKGTYIRSLARDLGLLLGTGAYLSSLVRMRTGGFSLCEAWTIGELQELEPAAVWPQVAVHPDAIVSAWPSLVVDAADTVRWRMGQRILRTGRHDGPVRVHAEQGAFLGIAAAADDATWQPTRVMAEVA